MLAMKLAGSVNCRPKSVDKKRGRRSRLSIIPNCPARNETEPAPFAATISPSVTDTYTAGSNPLHGPSPAEDPVQSSAPKLVPDRRGLCTELIRLRVPPLAHQPRDRTHAALHQTVKKTVLLRLRLDEIEALDLDTGIGLERNLRTV